MNSWNDEGNDALSTRNKARICTKFGPAKYLMTPGNPSAPRETRYGRNLKGLGILPRRPRAVLSVLPAPKGALAARCYDPS